MEVIFRSDDWDLVVKENSVLPQRKQARRKCMVVTWLLAHMSRHLNCACMRRGGGAVYNIFIGKKTHASFAFEKLFLGGLM